jgi:hypothetical protein
MQKASSGGRKRTDKEWGPREASSSLSRSGAPYTQGIWGLREASNRKGGTETADAAAGVRCSAQYLAQSSPSNIHTGMWFLCAGVVSCTRCCAMSPELAPSSKLPPQHVRYLCTLLLSHRLLLAPLLMHVLPLVLRTPLLSWTVWMTRMLLSPMSS